MSPTRTMTMTVKVADLPAVIAALEAAREKIESLQDALGLLRGHVVDDEGWKLINDALRPLGLDPSKNGLPEHGASLEPEAP